MIAIYLTGLVITLVVMWLRVVDFSWTLALIWPLYWAFAALLYTLVALGARFGQ